MIIDVRPGIFGGKYLSLPGRKDVVVEDLHSASWEGKTALWKMITFDLDLCLNLN
jgi:hypothetical protein